MGDRSLGFSYTLVRNRRENFSVRGTLTVTEYFRDKDMNSLMWCKTTTSGRSTGSGSWHGECLINKLRVNHNGFYCSMFKSRTTERFVFRYLV